ncbi:Multiple RNA-binding domain-containing protein 1 [Leucoagaricus sp. SymC.cos]|nr:Multiple RNA-binding domain-containing protein 1 [Leucoagaricus sp. SymC.cos]
MSAGSGILPENALAGFHRNTNSVRVDNVSKNGTSEVVALFSALVGQIRTFNEIKDALGTHLEVTFFNREAATKALCMTGYNIGGAFLAVTPITAQLPNHRIRHSADDRRNLYVLGLPFALTKNEFAALFSRYGTVSHCVILATVDNSSRRRGFIVMSTHEEAKLAMSELTRTQIKGHTIDVSWAVVQRSQGFLDGGDRAMLLDSRTSAPPTRDDSAFRYLKDTSDIPFDPMESGLGTYTASADPSATLLVSKLPAILFSQTRDLEPLFYPYGTLKKLQVAGIGLNGTLSVFVQYHSVSAAQEAKQALHGQNYVNCQVEVQFLRTTTSPFDLVQISRVVSPIENVNPIKTQPRVIMDSSETCRSFEQYDSSGSSDVSSLDKQSFLATPNFDNNFRDRSGMRFNSTSSRWSANIGASDRHTITQHIRANNFLVNNQYQNLLA